ncbi:MAG TPA: tryptophan synthase subunit alpha [Massilia sp.]|nr:tryptophan synthase subunit alpha [Massilia sp.]
MERYQQLFKRLQANKEGAFVPFVTLGDPTPALSLQIIDTLVEAGADALELGIPFSDPLADGPTIQNATLRAFAAGTTPAHCFEMLATIRQKYPDLPIGLLMYANLVFTNGVDAFYARCEQAGVDSVLVADVPVEESGPFRQAAMRHNVAPIFICPPNADDDLLRAIASWGRGYIYLLSRAGVSWAWYGGAWQAAIDGRGAGQRPNFQHHHQPFNYFKQFAPGTEAREEHLRDGGLGDSPISNKFIADAVAGKLPAVSFYKPQGNLNLHAGYSDIESGDAHVANVIEHLKKSPQWQDMVVVITFDENGGWWDHVAPPQGDRWGPGSRIPAIVVSPHAKKGAVDHNYYDTTSILRLITRLHGLPLLEGLAARDAAFASRGARGPGDLTAALSFR